MIQARVRVLDTTVGQQMKDTKSIEFELTTPDKEVVLVKVNPEEVFSYNTTLSKSCNHLYKLVSRW